MRRFFFVPLFFSIAVSPIFANEIDALRDEIRQLEGRRVANIERYDEAIKLSKGFANDVLSQLRNQSSMESVINNYLNFNDSQFVQRYSVNKSAIKDAVENYRTNRKRVLTLLREIDNADSHLDILNLKLQIETFKEKKFPAKDIKALQYKLIERRARDVDVDVYRLIYEKTGSKEQAKRGGIEAKLRYIERAYRNMKKGGLK